MRRRRVLLLRRGRVRLRLLRWIEAEWSGGVRRGDAAAEGFDGWGRGGGEGLELAESGLKGGGEGGVVGEMGRVELGDLLERH